MDKRYVPSWPCCKKRNKSLCCVSLLSKVLYHPTLSLNVVLYHLSCTFTPDVISLFRRAELNLHLLPCSQWQGMSYPGHVDTLPAFYQSVNRTRRRENPLRNVRWRTTHLRQNRFPSVLLLIHSTDFFLFILILLYI